MFHSCKRALGDLRDVFRRARSVREVARALLPAGMQKRIVLNAEAVTDGAIDPSALAAHMRTLCNQLSGEAIDEQGRVAYAGLEHTDTFARLRESARSLPAVSPDDLTDDAERHAFWINLYNVLAIHGVIALEIETSVMEIPSFFARVAYQIGRDTFTLDDIENGVLRRNAAHPATRARMFGKSDPRLAFCVERVDPRIHAALVCASTSCPAVAFYDPERIDQQLAAAADNYVACEVLLQHGRVLLPITFRYYAADYGDGPDAVWEFLLRHSSGEQEQALRSARADGHTFEYRRYDWSLNAT